MKLEGDADGLHGVDQFSKGDQFEMLVMRTLKKDGIAQYFKKYDPRLDEHSKIIFCNRTKGSRGEGDILVLVKNNVTHEVFTLIIQAKRNGYIDPADRKKYLKVMNACENDPMKRASMWLAHYTHGKYWRITPLKTEDDLFQRRYR